MSCMFFKYFLLLKLLILIILLLLFQRLKHKIISQLYYFSWRPQSLCPLLLCRQSDLSVCCPTVTLGLPFTSFLCQTSYIQVLRSFFFLYFLLQLECPEYLSGVSKLTGLCLCNFLCSQQLPCKHLLPFFQNIFSTDVSSSIFPSPVDLAPF